MAQGANSVFSFEKFNYLLRPKKQIERKIIIEILLELKSYLKNFKGYEYIGMGSIYYYDFILFHKYLDLHTLTSLDDKITKKRFEFNKPFDFVKFENQRSTDYLSSRSWDSNSIIWMDYDFALNDVVLEDLGILSRCCINKDLLIFTLDARCDFEGDQKLEFLDQFDNYIEPKFKKEKYFTPFLFPQLLEHICLNIFREQMQYESIKFNKVFSFTYADRAKMYTLGGVFSKPNLAPKLTSQFASNNSRKIIDIDVPHITYKEKYYLDSKIFGLKNSLQDLKEKLKRKNFQAGSDEEKVFVAKTLKLDMELSVRDIEDYSIYYKYMPQYYEGII